MEEQGKAYAQSGQILLGKAIRLLAWLVQVSASRICARQISQVGRAIFGCTVARPDNLAIAALAPVNSHDRSGSVFLSMIRHIYAQR